MQMRATESRLSQRRERLVETIGRHAFEGREIGRFLRIDAVQRQALRRRPTLSPQTRVEVRPPEAH
jgi:hypothetical protein